MPPAGNVSRLLSCSCAGAIVAMGPGLASCSALLDWTGYSAGSSPVDDAGDGGEHEASRAEASVPQCTSATCGGCCASGFCSGGESASSCGTGGRSCQDCSARGLACRAGSCTPEAGPPPVCVASNCTQCIPAIQIGCCKADGTCGCQYVPAPGAPQGCK